MSAESYSAGITGTGSYLPEKILTNHDLEKIVETSDEWIRTRTGIQERRIAAEGQATSDLAFEAARKALEDAELDAVELDLIIVATVTPDMFFPATACIVQEKLGAKKAAAFDLSAGCSGFVYGLATGSQFIKTGAYKNVLVIGAETLSRITNWRDRSTCVLFGDAAGAAVLQRVEEGFGLLSFELGADGTGGQLLKIQAGGSRRPCTVDTVNNNLHYIEMAGNEVYRFAVTTVPRTAEKVIKKAGLTKGDIDYFVPHQANIRIIDAAAKRLDLDREKVFVNLHKYGNTSAASVPVALDEAVREGKIKKGDNVLTVGFGAGLTWAGALIKWVK